MPKTYPPLYKSLTVHMNPKTDELHFDGDEGVKKLLQFLITKGEYLTECPECCGSSEGEFPPMDEDGCCASCGADCSINGAIEHLKEQVAATESAQTALETLKYHMDEFAYQELHSALHP